MAKRPVDTSSKVKPGSILLDVLTELGLEPSKITRWDNMGGFAAHLSADQLHAVRASDKIESICEDGIMKIGGATVTQTDAPWGLQRISQKAKLSSTSASALNYKYTYDSSGGEGVDVYVVDTGINIAHVDFGGRASWGATFGGYANADGNGHGTHVAGTAGGTRFGVAKSAKLIAVKVLSDSGSGSVSDIISGLNWVMNKAKSTGRPSVMNLSLGGGASSALDNAVASLTKAGVHVVVAAGNSNVDAANTSPARAPSAIAVGATTIADARASFSNYGSVVSVFAPGANIISDWINSTTATNTLSGTSMASPHVAGLVAYFVKKDGNITPAAMRTKIQNLAIRNAISGIPSGTVNLLANNNS
ncbi:hypothetical protein NLJ89_g5739 [Agrocybe chaxingu]|uniref:Peptidase S8/S53 domain-containing protein n=1 Tax=Agrocybe chaxingu TaxID=84603 RepID=A0A9W8MVC0_9AGAR|nr:hypothetical protein NLJ89_g5739 [Agrocybe chaxingu]